MSSINKSTNNVTILDEYLAYFDKYQKIYGTKSTVLYQNGLFFEIYGVDNDEEKLGNVYEIAKITGLQATRRTKAVLENNRTNFLMAGFPLYQIEKYINILVEQNNYTCIIIEQTEDQKDQKDQKNQKNKIDRKIRKVTGIVSPATNVKYLVKSNSNYLLLLLFQKEKCSNISSIFKSSISNKLNFNLISVGMTAIDLSTGEVITYYIFNRPDDEHIIYDEIIRFSNILNPVEYIIYYDDDLSYDTIKEQLDIDDTKSIHIYKNSVIPLDYYKPAFQNTYFSKIYKDCGLLEPIEYLDLERLPLLSLTFILAIDYCYKQNENIIQFLEIPQIWNNKKNLSLDSNALVQLNIIENGCSDSLYHILDFCSTSAGRRYLRQRLSLPFTDVNDINNSYNIIEIMRSIIDDKPDHILYLYCEFEKYLKSIIDIERYHRKISLGIITVEEYITLQNSYKSILFIISLTGKYLDKYFDSSLLQEYINFINMYSLLKDRYIDINTYSIFNEGVYTELENYEKDIKVYNDEINKFISEFSNLIMSNNNNNSELISIKYDEDIFITLTKTRWNNLCKKYKNADNKNADNKNANNKSNDYVFTLGKYKIKISEFNLLNERDTKDVKISCNSFINYMNEYKDLKNILKSKNEEYFTNFINNIKEHNFILCSIAQYISHIDFYKSASKCSIIYNYCKPIISRYAEEIKMDKKEIKGEEIKIDNKEEMDNKREEIKEEEREENISSYIIAKNLRHALIEKIQRKVQYVPQDVDLYNERSLLLFGVNCSGKSSYMRSIGVSIVMAQAGLYVPATYYRYYPYELLLTRIIGNDNIKKGKSTFAVEMEELRGILKRSNNRSLILGDEICHGTETVSALSIVSASLYRLCELSSNVVFTTHLHYLCNIKQIKELIDNNKLHLYHFKVSYDNDNNIIIYDRKLEKGSGSTLYGLEVAKWMNFDNNFITLANDIRREIIGIDKDFMNTQRSNYNKDLYMDKCMVCNNKAVDTHHIKFQSCANNIGFIEHIHKDHLSNLVPLCKECHQGVHASPPKLKINGYIERSDRIVLDYEYL